MDKQFIDTGSPSNVVNVRSSQGAGAKLVIRHYNGVGVLARVLDLLRDEGINIEEMQNLIFEHNEAASCSLTVDIAPSAALISRLGEAEEIIEVVAE